MERIESYAPVADGNCRTLIVGTAPSVESLRAGFFYGHPRNAFWRILAEVFGGEIPGTIGDKKALLLNNRIALWDVCRSCLREGSLDGNIRSVEPNDFAGLFEQYPGIRRVLFNGGTAEALFFRLCGGALGDRPWARLPSTSPAYTLPYAQKLERWRKELTDDDQTL